MRMTQRCSLSDLRFLCCTFYAIVINIDHDQSLERSPPPTSLFGPRLALVTCHYCKRPAAPVFILKCYVAPPPYLIPRKSLSNPLDSQERLGTGWSLYQPDSVQLPVSGSGGHSRLLGDTGPDSRHFHVVPHHHRGAGVE